MTGKLIYTAGLSVLFFALLSFYKDSKTELNAKNIEQNLAKISDDLYASKCEVSNGEYQLFLSELKNEDPLQAGKYKVDSTKWLSGGAYQQPMANYYHLHPAYKNYPVVCVSYEAALAYCDWLSNKYNSESKRKFSKVKFYLPSEEEWTMVANGGNKNKMYPWAAFYLRNNKGEFLCNFKHVGDQFISYNAEKKEYFIIPEARVGSLNDGAMYTSPVKSFPEVEPYGLYNVSGNVAEMVNEKGIAKGGSYNSTGYDVRISSRMTYTESSPEIGFRVFMKVLEK